MIVSRVVPSPLPDLHPTARLADAARPYLVVQEHRAARATPRGRHTPQNQPETAPGLGRPGGVVEGYPLDEAGLVEVDEAAAFGVGGVELAVQAGHIGRI